MDPQVYLLSAPSNTGKTTALAHYVDVLRKNGKSVGGVLQIVKEGRRHIRFLSDDSLKLLQVNEVFAHNIGHDRHFIKHHGHSDVHCNHGDDERMNVDYDESLYVKCGKFLCSKDVLNEAQIELNNAHKYDFVIIDEVGNWELKKGKGYEPALSNILQQRRDKFKNTKFIIVVRPSLKEQLIQYLKLKKGEYSDFEDLYEWQLSLKVCKKFVLTSFFAGIALCFFKQINKQIKK